MSQTKAQLIGAVGVSTADNFTIYGGLVGVAATFTGNVSVGGTLTYEDVTNVDSIGFVTARSGIEVGESLISGIGATILPTGNAVFAGIVTATNVSVASSITAATFYGNGSGLTGAGSTVADDTTTNANFYPVFTQTTSGTITASKVSTSKLSFNPSTGTLTVNGGTVWNSNNDGSGSGLDADTLDGVDSSSFLRSDAADQKTSGTLRFDDNIILSFGTGDDAEFFCNGTHFYLDLNSGIGNFYIRDGTTTRFTFDDAGAFTATGNVTAYSDISLKENIETIPNALDKVLNLRGVEFDRVDIKNRPHQIGVIAQEIEKVIPEVVATNEDGIKSVAYGNLVGLLVEAIKEQQEQIKNQQEQINELRALLEDK